jgi:hypothetical protein
VAPAAAARSGWSVLQHSAAATRQIIEMQFESPASADVLRQETSKRCNSRNYAKSHRKQGRWILNPQPKRGIPGITTFSASVSSAFKEFRSAPNQYPTAILGKIISIF